MEGRRRLLGLPPRVDGMTDAFKKIVAANGVAGERDIYTACLHEQCFSVSDATAASDTAQKIGLFLSLDAAVASDTEKHCLCKQTITRSDILAKCHNTQK
jgi:hypothetical protein